MLEANSSKAFMSCVNFKVRLKCQTAVGLETLEDHVAVENTEKEPQSSDAGRRADASALTLV